jgi:hypothetical protein
MAGGANYSHPPNIANMVSAVQQYMQQSLALPYLPTALTSPTASPSVAFVIPISAIVLCPNIFSSLDGAIFTAVGDSSAANQSELGDKRSVGTSPSPTLTNPQSRSPVYLPAYASPTTSTTSPSHASPAAAYASPTYDELNDLNTDKSEGHGRPLTAFPSDKRFMSVPSQERATVIKSFRPGRIEGNGRPSSRGTFRERVKGGVLGGEEMYSGANVDAEDNPQLAT